MLPLRANNIYCATSNKSIIQKPNNEHIFY